MEYWLDPESAASKSSSGTDPSSEGSGSSPESPASAPPVIDNSAELNQPKVFCQKGKCYPYDPARMKNQNVQGALLNYQTPRVH